jgi:hypothetical protein
MSEENKKLVRRWFEEVWNQQNEEAIDAMFASGGKAYGFPEPHSVLVGPESFKEIHRFFLGPFPTSASRYRRSSQKVTKSPFAGLQP